MMEIGLYEEMQVAMLVLAVIVFIMLLKIPAGYGKMVSRKWIRFGSINNKAGWFLMELPTMIFVIFYYNGNMNKGLVGTIFLLIWLIHYVYRTFMFPLLLRGKTKMPILIILMGSAFNMINVFIQASWLYFIAPEEMYSNEWIGTPQFITGIILFFFGYYTTLRSDHIIRNLRKDSHDTKHYIPHGFLFKHVCCANYLGEIIEWLGWAVMTWSTAGLVFFIWTFANLVPRALATHKWYIEKFGEEYKKLNRKVVIPFMW